MTDKQSKTVLLDLDAIAKRNLPGVYGETQVNKDNDALVAEVRVLRAAVERGRAFADNMEEVGRRLAVKHGSGDEEAAKILADQLRSQLEMR